MLEEGNTVEEDKRRDEGRKKIRIRKDNGRTNGNEERKKRQDKREERCWRKESDEKR